MIIISILFSCNSKKETVKSLQEQYPNVLDIEYIPQKEYDIGNFGFSDMGAWHGYALPHRDSSRYYGSFTGPLLMKTKGRWLSKSLFNLGIILNGKKLNLAKAKVTINYYPGKLEQQLEIDSLQAKISLIFVSNRTALLQTEVSNVSNSNVNIIICNSGELLDKEAELENIYGGIRINFNNKKEYFLIRSDGNVKTVIDSVDKSYKMYCSRVINLKPQNSSKINLLHSYYFNENEQNKEKDSIESWFINTEKLFRDNTKRWDKYISSILNHKTKLLEKEDNRKLAVKCIETLLTNWRSAAGALHYDGVFPSASYQGFYGFWSWDSWKHAVALSHFFPELAKSSVLSMFQYQDSLGMIADCVYFNPKENNWRDTKPPLATWAVVEIFNQTKDTAFVRKMYPKLVKYHNWWYKYRDHNSNMLCEYGSTDGTLIAAKWESGMDNAVRFDSAKILQNNTVSWSMNQESVDLNSYLYAEKLQLSELAEILNKTDDALSFKQDADKLKQLIQTKFWDNKTAYFYDREIPSGKLLTVQQATEAWIPLYTQIATKKQAAAIKTIMADPKKFKTKVPLPTLSASNPKFNPLNGYWRGPVWIDQAHFGIKGLQKYGYNSLADSLLHSLIHNAEGLLDKDAIRENYHPITGKGLNACNFSWSAAHYLMLLADY